MAAPKEYKDNLGKLIKQRREILDISQREFARRAEIPSHSTIRSLENGDYLDYPERETLEKIAKNIFKISLDELLELIDAKPANPNLMIGSVILQIERLETVEDCLEAMDAISRRVRVLLSEK